jgi:thiol reductant ABC exporter CydD subunit
VSPRARRDLLAAIGAGSVAGILLILQGCLLGHAVDDVFIGRRPLTSLGFSLLALGLTATARAACAWAGDVFAQLAAVRAKRALRTEALSTIIRRGPAGRQEQRTGDTSFVLTAGLDTVDAFVAQFLPQAALAAIVPVMVLVAVVRLDPLSGLVLAITGPLMPVFMWLVGASARARAQAQLAALSRLSARFLDAVRSLGMLKAFGRAAAEAETLALAGARYASVSMGVLRVAFLSALILELLATIGVAIVAVEVGLRLLYGRILFRDAFVVLILAPEFYRPFRSLGAAFHAGQAGRETLARLRHMGTASGATRRSPPSRTSGVVIDGPPAVGLRGVTFSYRPERPPAVRDLDLHIPPGSTVALVGPTGSGKSTIAQLCLGFVEPQSGLVVINGSALADVSGRLWRKHVAWVPQRPHVFRGTLRDNLLMARHDASADHLRSAVERAHLDEVVARLPRGLDTPLGDRGERLSSGQVQRLALARAFLKDSPFLVLDEPTAQVDPGTESLIVSSLCALRAGRTVLLIAHRLPTVAAADRVVVLSHGRIVEADTPERLRAAGGRYAAMVRATGGAP